MEEHQQAQVAAGLVAPQPMMGAPQMDMGNSFLPAVLLQQYPALANIDWNAIPATGGTGGIEEEYSGRSSFDASSGGELYEDLSENEMGNFNAGMNNINSMNPMGVSHQPMGAAQSQGGAQGFGGPYAGNQTSDYLRDFEGR